MVQEVSNGDRFAVSGKIGKEFRERLVIAEFSVVDEEQDGHGSELFGEGSQAEIGASNYLRFRTEIAGPFGSRENISASVAHQNCEARFVGFDQPGEDGLFHALHGFTSLARKLRGVKEEKQWRSHYPKNSVQHAHLESAAEHIIPAGRSSRAGVCYRGQTPGRRSARMSG